MAAEKHDALKLQLLPIGISLSGWVVAAVFSFIFQPIARAGGLLISAGIVVALLVLLRLLNELKTRANDTTLVPWIVFVPCYNLYFMATVVQPLAARAKAAAGKPAARSPVLYALFGIYALASDLNDLRG